MKPDGSALIQLTESLAVDRDPAWSPDGTLIAFRSRRDGSSDIFIMYSDGSNQQNIIRDRQDSIDDEFNPSWHPSGEELVIYTDRFQPAQGICIGSRGIHHLAFLPITGGNENIFVFNGAPGEQTAGDWSPDGTTLAFSSICSADKQQLFLWVRDTDQLIEPIKEEINPVTPVWSPDGSKIAFVSSHTKNSEIYIFDLFAKTLNNLSQHPASDLHPTWSPDGNMLAFASNREGNYDIYTISINGTELRNITQHPADDQAPDWSPVDNEN